MKRLCCFENTHRMLGTSAGSLQMVDLGAWHSGPHLSPGPCISHSLSVLTAPLAEGIMRLEEKAIALGTCSRKTKSETWSALRPAIPVPPTSPQQGPICSLCSAHQGVCAIPPFLVFSLMVAFETHLKQTQIYAEVGEPGVE